MLALAVIGGVVGCAKKKPPSRELTMERWAKRQAEKGIQVSTEAVVAAIPRPTPTVATPVKAVGKPATLLAGGLKPASTAALLQGTTTGVEVKIHRIYDYNTGTRDPFLPLIGTGVGAGGSSEKVNLPTASGAFNLNVLTLRGILWGGQQPMAILSDSAGGTYIVRDGRVVDNHGKEVRGVTGIIRPKSVILTTASRTVRELKIEIAGVGGAGMEQGLGAGGVK